jgi:hypothetical protein
LEAKNLVEERREREREFWLERERDKRIEE